MDGDGSTTDDDSTEDEEDSKTADTESGKNVNNPNAQTRGLVRGFKKTIFLSKLSNLKINKIDNQNWSYIC